MSYELIGCDYSNVEGRCSAWVAGEAWKVQAFRDYDAGSGPDLYKVAYGRAFGVDPAGVDKAGRQVGKVMELASGYGGSVGAYVHMGFDLAPLVATVDAAEVDADLWASCEGRWCVASAQDRHGLQEGTWLAVRYLVAAWRAAHPNIVQAWWDLQNTCVAAVEQPGVTFSALNGRVAFRCTPSRSGLHMRLPSGRALHYFKPRAVTEVEEIEREDGTTWERTRRSVSYLSATGPSRLYAGLLHENLCQAVCRDILAQGLMNLDAAGYRVVLHVHDEAVVEVPGGTGSVEDVQRLMCEMPAWADGFPLAAAGWRDKRYVK